VDILEIIPNV